MSLALEFDYQQEQNMSLEPRSGRVVLEVMLRRERLPGPSTFAYRTFRRPYTEVGCFADLVCPVIVTDPSAFYSRALAQPGLSHYH